MFKVGLDDIDEMIIEGVMLLNELTGENYDSYVDARKSGITFEEILYYSLLADGLIEGVVKVNNLLEKMGKLEAYFDDSKKEERSYSKVMSLENLFSTRGGRNE